MLSADALIDWPQRNMGRSRDILVSFVLSRSTVYNQRRESTSSHHIAFEPIIIGRTIFIPLAIDGTHLSAVVWDRARIYSR